MSNEQGPASNVDSAANQFDRVMGRILSEIDGCVGHYGDVTRLRALGDTFAMIAGAYVALESMKIRRDRP